MAWALKDSFYNNSTEKTNGYSQRLPCAKGAVSEADWGIVFGGILAITIPPSRRCRATSLYTREAFCLSVCAHLLTTNGGSANAKSRYGNKSISAFWLSFRTRGWGGEIFLFLTYIRKFFFLLGDFCCFFVFYIPRQIRKCEHWCYYHSNNNSAEHEVGW